MPSCRSCSSAVPSGQNLCSMCYGDPDYGRDGYYRKFLEDQELEEAYRQKQLDDEEYFRRLREEQP